MKGGIGSASIRVGGVTVAALVAVNATGDVIDPADGAVLAGARTSAEQPPPGAQRRRRCSAASCRRACRPAWPPPSASSPPTPGSTRPSAASWPAWRTTAWPAASTRSTRLHDGDTLFALATGASGPAGNLTLIGALAAEVTARAVISAIHHASGLPGLPAARDLGGAL